MQESTLDFKCSGETNFLSSKPLLKLMTS